MKQSPIFIKSFETIVWLFDHTKKFPKHQRFVMAKRMEEAALGFHEQLVWATKSTGRGAALMQADFHLEQLRFLGRLSMNLKLLSFEQYEFLAAALDELGRLLGGWMRAISKPTGDAGRKGVGD